MAASAAHEDTIAIGTDVLTGDMRAPAIMTTPDGCYLLMVADGMGGHAHGAMASRAVLRKNVTLRQDLAAAIIELGIAAAAVVR